MKQKNNAWFFESYQEIRDYLAQDIRRMGHFVYLSTRQRAWIGDHGEVIADTNAAGEPYVITKEDSADWIKPLDYVYSHGHSIRAEIGSTEDFPATDYAVNQVCKVVELEADTAVQGFYKAGDHLAAHCRTVGQERTKFTTKDLTAVKNGVVLSYEYNAIFLYRIRTQTGYYQCHQDSLWDMMLAMEKAEGVGPSRRRVFTILGQKEREQEPILHLSFMMDKEVSHIKRCLETDDLRPMMESPVIETATGIMVASDGHILAAHKLQGYEIDLQSGLPVQFKGLLSIPKEVCQMKGRVTIEAVEGKWEDSYVKKDGTSKLVEVEGVIVTAVDEKGHQAVVRQAGCYPNWRSVIPQSIGPAIGIDTTKLSDGVKRIMPQLNSSSNMLTVSAGAGDNSLVLSGEDYDFSKGGSVNVELSEKMPCDMRVGLKASLLATVMGFSVSTMHYKSADHAVIFIGEQTVILQMPMLIDGLDKAPRPDDKQLKRFDIDKWAGSSGAAPAAKAKTPKAAAKARPAAACSKQAETTATIEDRLRAALRRQLAVAA